MTGNPTDVDEHRAEEEPLIVRGVQVGRMPAHVGDRAHRVEFIAIDFRVSDTTPEALAGEPIPLDRLAMPLESAVRMARAILDTAARLS